MKTIQINNHTLEFYKDTHTYLVDGICRPCVSDILKFKFNDYINVPKSVLEQASIKGTALHSAIETYEKTGQESDLKEFRNYLFLKKAKGFENVENELPVIYEEDGEVLFIGTLDQIILINEKLGINDFKRVSAPNKAKITYQLNLYKLAYEQSYHKSISTLHFTQLREDIRKFIQLPIIEEETKELIKEFYKERGKNVNRI